MSQGHHPLVRHVLGDVLARFPFQTEFDCIGEGKPELHLQKCCAMRPAAAQLPAVQMDLDSDLTQAAGTCRRNKK